MKYVMKKTVALLLAVILVIGILPAASAAPVAGFQDVSGNDWFAPYVQYVFDNKLMNGTEKGFEPEGTCTRAMAAVVIYRASGDPKPEGKATFTDLTQDWYQEGILWAQKNGVVNGVGNNKFDPDGVLTREQLVTMIWRYQGSKKVKTDYLTPFPDRTEVDKWAREAFNWAIGKRIIGGSNGKLIPLEAATRAQFAKIITVDHEAEQKTKENRITVGCLPNTLTGDFTCGILGLGQGDQMVNELINDYGIMVMDKTGTLVQNQAVAENIAITENGSCFTVTLRKDLKYNDGTPITAKDYVFSILLTCSPAAGDLGILDDLSPVVEGGDLYATEITDCLMGLEMHPDDPYTFTITLNRNDQDHYYFADSCLDVQPMNVKFWLGEEYDVNFVDASETGCAVTDRNFHPVSLQAEKIQEKFDAARMSGSEVLSAGPYMVETWDMEASRCILKRNPNYGGNFEGQKPAIETIEVVCMGENDWQDQLNIGNIDVYPGITQKEEIDNFLKMAEADPELSYVSYDRAGYGKIQFLCDVGPTQFVEVRRAMARLLDREALATAFCGEGRYKIVNGPYATAMRMYQDSKQVLAAGLDPYEFNVEEAEKELTDGGWTLDENGNEWSGTGLRCKDVTNLRNINTVDCIQAKDGRHLMPLKIKWYATEDNRISELLKIMLADSEALKKAGMAIEQTVGDFDGLIEVLYHEDAEGHRIEPKYSMVNMGTGWTSSLYDYSHNWSSDPLYVEKGFNGNYLFDSQDRDLDQLSMEMVFNVMPGDYDEYLRLWQEYVIRWNEVLPDIPLYTETYFTAIPVRLRGYEENAFWGFPYAILYAKLGEPDKPDETVRENKITVGVSVPLQGNFANDFLTINPSDRMVSGLINDYSIMAMDRTGFPVLNDKSVVQDCSINRQGQENTIYTYELKKGLRYNDGTPITSKDFVTWILFCCSPAAKEMNLFCDLSEIIEGGEAFRNGENDFLSGVHIIADDAFSVTVTMEYSQYYFTEALLSAQPMNAAFWLGADFDVMATEEGCAFAQNQDPMALYAEEIKEPFSAAVAAGNKTVSAGPYMIDTWDPETGKCVLKRNPNYAGNLEGQKPSIETIEVVCVEGDAWKEQLRTGKIDVYPEITGRDEIEDFLKMTEADKDLSYASYDRAGYGKIQFLCDVGPTQFAEVRRAIAMLLDREALAEAHCGEGRYKIVNGPFATGMKMYQDSEKLFAEKLNPYEFNVEKANGELEAGGWTLDKNGNKWNGTGLRYKDVTDIMRRINTDGCSRTNDGRLLMPLKIEWYATENYDVSDLLKTLLADSETVKKAGMEIVQTVGDMQGMSDILFHTAETGEFYQPKYGMVNLAEGWTSSIYDCSFQWGSNASNLPGWNDHYLYDSKDGDLDQLSMQMVYMTMQGDYEAYLDCWQKYVIRWNEVLPDIPLYTNTYYEAVPAWLEGYEPNAFWRFENAILYATVSETK